jgi:hypothetical protein
MARFLQGLIPHVKKFALYMGFNPEVATKNWPSRGTYRVAPASAPAPTFTHNFPLKQEQIADLEFQDRATRLGREAMDMRVIFAHTDSRRDIRNVWNNTRKQNYFSMYQATTPRDFLLPRMEQVSERHEISL